MKFRGALLGLTSTVLGCGELATASLGIWNSDDSASGGSGSGEDVSDEAGGGGSGSALTGSVVPLDAELWTGAVRLVAQDTRLTLGVVEGALGWAPFGGESNQMWLLDGSEQALHLTHELSAQCLSYELELGDCAAQASFRVVTERAVSLVAPGTLRLEGADGRCVLDSGDALGWGDCAEPSAKWHVEATGWGRRVITDTPDYVARLGLLIKGLGAVTNAGLTLDIPGTNQDAVAHAFDECTRIWLASLTDGRVAFESVVQRSTHPLEALENSCSSSVPAASELTADYDDFVTLGDLDGVVTYYRLGAPDDGWSCSGIGGPEQAGLAHQAYGGDDAAWLACGVTPSNTFIQAFLGMAAPFYRDLGVPAPEQLLDGAPAEYSAGAFDWNHYRRDYLLGRVIRADGTYGGLGPRAFSRGTIRSHAER